MRLRANQPALWALLLFSLVLVYFLIPGPSPTRPSSRAVPAQSTKPRPFKPSSTEKSTTYRYELIKSYPHNRSYFTQGFQLADGLLYEGTGLYGLSELLAIDIFGSGKVEKSIALEKNYFGEGITVDGDKIYQLTWEEHVGFIYNRTTFGKIGQWTYNHPGWGITHNKQHLIVSDGSDKIRFLDKQTQKEVRSIRAIRDKQYVARLNELEWIDGYIWANIWGLDILVVINPDSGEIVGVLDLTHLHQKTKEDDVLNGIAWNAETNHLFVTGKKWNVIYELAVSSK